MIKKKIITYLSLALILLSGTIGVFVGLHNKNKAKEEILVFDESETPVITNNNVEHNLRMRNVGDVLTVVASITPEDATVQNVSWSFVEEGVTGKLTIISQDGLTCRVRKKQIMLVIILYKLPHKSIIKHQLARFTRQIMCQNSWKVHLLHHMPIIVIGH